MTLATLRTYVWQYLDDSDGIRTGTGGYFSNAIVNAWLNRALVEVQKLLIQSMNNWYLKCQMTTTVLNQREYALPDDFFKSHRLELTLSGSGVTASVIQLRPITLNQQDKVGKGAGTPGFFLMKKDSFELYPAPDDTYSMDLFYSYRVAEMSADGDEPDCPDQYQELIAILAAYNGFIKDDRVPSVLQMKKEEYLALLKQDAIERQADEPRHILLTDDDQEGSWLF